MVDLNGFVWIRPLFVKSNLMMVLHIYKVGFFSFFPAGSKDYSYLFFFFFFFSCVSVFMIVLLLDMHHCQPWVCFPVEVHSIHSIGV